MPHDLEIFLDENHHNNKKLLDFLSARAVTVHRYGDYFAPQVPDTEWMALVGQHGWTVITTDKRIRYRPLERAAVEKNKVGMYCFTSNMGSDKMVAALEKAFPRMRTIHAKQPRPYIATISEGGYVEVRESFGHEIASLRE
jgi:hypothetical protein